MITLAGRAHRAACPMLIWLSAVGCAGASDTGGAQSSNTSDVPAASSGTAATPTASLPVSWRLPDLDPCTLVTAEEAEVILGPLRRLPVPGGFRLDGTSCAYDGMEAVIVNVGVISTAVFEVQKRDLSYRGVPELGYEAFLAEPVAMGDIFLFARTRTAAVVVHVSAPRHAEGQRGRMATAYAMARTALRRLP